jgi:hypothetical protein
VDGWWYLFWLALAKSIELFYISLPVKYLLIPLTLLLLSVSVNSQAIYKTPTGKKYHLGSCHMVKNVSEKISPEKARSLGLEPCKICKPNINNLKSSVENKAKGEGVSVQCRGVTKAGTRCKHTTRIANGYCFQHQSQH